MDVAREGHLRSRSVRLQRVPEHAGDVLLGVTHAEASRGLEGPYFRGGLLLTALDVDRDSQLAADAQGSWREHVDPTHEIPPAGCLAEIHHVGPHGLRIAIDVNRVCEGPHQFVSSSSKICSTGFSNRRAIFSASGRLGSYLPVSIALIAWRETPTRRPSSICDQLNSARRTLR